MYVHADMKVLAY